MANLTDTAENLMLDWVNAVGTPTRPTAPIKCALMTANGTDAAAGTEVAPGANAYARQNITLAAAASGATSNTNLLEWLNMPGVTVVGVEVWDSAATPVRLWHGALTANKVVNAGDPFRIPIGDLDLVLG